MAEFQIKISQEQHAMLLSCLGSEEAIHEYIQSYIDRKIQEILNLKGTKKDGPLRTNCHSS
jgi:hypothetical protein